jgi:hypothetical protein
MKPECVGQCWNTAADAECIYGHDERPGNCPGYRPIFKATDTKDMVNHPSHYAGQIEVIDYIRDKLTPEGFTEYCCGNVLKYVSRWRKKDGIQDLKKARVYLDWMIENAEKEHRTDT